jgi:hypothetical protein
MAGRREHTQVPGRWCPPRAAPIAAALKENRNRWRWEGIGTAAGGLIQVIKTEQILSAEEPLLEPIARSVPPAMQLQLGLSP